MQQRTYHQPSLIPFSHAQIKHYTTSGLSTISSPKNFDSFPIFPLGVGVGAGLGAGTPAAGGFNNVNMRVGNGYLGAAGNTAAINATVNPSNLNPSLNLNTNLNPITISKQQAQQVQQVQQVQSNQNTNPNMQPTSDMQVQIKNQGVNMNSSITPSSNNGNNGNTFSFSNSFNPTNNPKLPSMPTVTSPTAMTTTTNFNLNSQSRTYSRPNYHFFGIGEPTSQGQLLNQASRRSASRSISPPVPVSTVMQGNGMVGPTSVIMQAPVSPTNYRNMVASTQPLAHPQIQQQPLHSRSHSPISIRSNSSEANKIKHRVKFIYSSNAMRQNLEKLRQPGNSRNQITNIVENRTRPMQFVQVVQPIGHYGVSGHASMQQVANHNHTISLCHQPAHPQPQPQVQVQPQPQLVITTTTTTIIWQHRFIQIYTKFQIFVQKFESIIEQIYYIDDMFDNVNDQQAWNQLRIRYAEMIDTFNGMRQDIILVLEQNKDAINSINPEVIKEIQEKNIGLEEQRANLEAHEGNQGDENGDHDNQEGEQGEAEDEGHQEQGGQTGKSQSQNNHIWQNRCLELMQQHEILTKQNNQLRAQNQRLRISIHKPQQHPSSQQEQEQHEPQYQHQANTYPEHSDPHSQPHHHQNAESANQKVLQMQKNLNLVHSEYQKLQGNYNKLSMQYSRVVSELQNRGPISSQDINQDLLEMQEQLEMAQSKINQLYEELQNKTQNIDNLEKQLQRYTEVIQQNKSLSQNINHLTHQLQGYEIQLQKKNSLIQDYDTELKKYHEQIMQYERILAEKQKQASAPVNTSAAQNQMQALSESRQSDSERTRRQIGILKEQQKNLLNQIQKHELTIQDLIVKYQKLLSDHESMIRQKQQQIVILQRQLQQRNLNQKSQNIQDASPSSSIQNLLDTKIFKERLQIQIDEIVSEKNRKIRHLSQDLQDIKLHLETLEKDKLKQIKQIKQYFTEEQDKYLKKINDKDNVIKLLQEKGRSYEHQLSNRNMQISRFRYQSPLNSPHFHSEQSKKNTQLLDKKNHELQQCNKKIEQKNILIKEHEQKISYLEQENNSKIFQINNLKRQINQLHLIKVQLDNLNNIVKRKNQQINQIRLTGVQIQQLRMTIDSLEREKIRINEYLKQKTRQCETKDNTISNLQRKYNTLSASVENNSTITKKYSSQSSNPVISNYENILKQKQTQIKNVKYELDMVEAKLQIEQKNIRDLNNKINNHQKSSALLKADMENKINRYQIQIRNLNKQVKTLQEVKKQYKVMIDTLQNKNSALERSLDQRNSIFDKQLGKNKQKVHTIQQINTTLHIDQQLLKSQIQRLTKQNKQLNEKIRILQTKIQSKNTTINEIKGSFNKKQQQDIKLYEQKIKKLDSQLKLSTMKLKNMQLEITNLNKKIQSAESEKRSYRQRLITEHNSSKQEFIDFKSQYDPINVNSNYEILEMQKFKLKDPQANEVFQRKVIYQLKKQNEFLRRQLSGIGPSSYSVNRYSSQGHVQSYQHQFFTQRAERDNLQSKNDEYNLQLVTFHKNKNKQLESRIDQLLKVNNQLKARLSSMNTNSTSQLSIQFYKDQITKLQSQNLQLQNKIKKMLSEHEAVKDQIAGHQHEGESMKDKINQQSQKINQLRKTINKYQDTISSLENSRVITLAEIQRLKEIADKAKNDREELNKKQRLLAQANKKIKSQQQEVNKLSAKISAQLAEIQKLTSALRSKNGEFENKMSQGGQEVKKLKKRISELEKQIALLNMQQNQKSSSYTDNVYKIEKLRSYLVEIDALIGEIPLNSSQRRGQDVIKQIRSQVREGLNTISLIQI